MTLHEEVRELEDWESSPDECLDIGDIEASVLNQMIDVLGCFQPGDAQILSDLLENWVYGESHPAVDVLRRLQKAAEMEAQ